LKIYKLGLICLSTLLFNTSVKAENDFTAGIGVGNLYGGIGINIGLQSSTDLKYVAVGCVSYSSKNGETCGLGIGYMTTSFFDDQAKKHAANFYVGIVGTERDYYEDKALYGAGLGYSYFFSGIDKSGFNIGFTLTGAKVDDGMDIGSLFQLGYQF